MISKGDAKNMHYQLLDWLERSSRVLENRPDPVLEPPVMVEAWQAHLEDLDDRRLIAMDALRVVADLHGPATHPRDPEVQPYCVHCSGRGEDDRVAFPCHTYRRVHKLTAEDEGVGAPSAITRAAKAREMTPRRVQPPFGEDLAVQRSECGDLVFNDGVRWGAELFPDREFLAAERKRFDLVDELMRSEEIARDEQTRAIAQAMFGAPFEGLTGPQRAAAEEATRRAEELSETGGADL